MMIKPIDSTIKNKYDSILKIAAYSFTNALIPILNLPEDDYEIVSCEIFSPGSDIKSMDILLKGKKGYIDIEFHKQALSKSHLERNFEYVVRHYFFYGETIDQRIVVVDKDRKSIEKIKITPDLEYRGNYFHMPEINGRKQLNIIKKKIENNQKLTEYENYVFSILPLTDHGYDNEEELVKELCYLSKELKTDEKTKNAICLCHMILIELFVNESHLKKELLGVITMTSTLIEELEDELKRKAEDEKERADNEKKRADTAEQKIEQIKENAKSLNLTDSQMKILLSTKSLK